MNTIDHILNNPVQSADELIITRLLASPFWNLRPIKGAVHHQKIFLKYVMPVEQ